jgi:hypothetical protein
MRPGIILLLLLLFCSVGWAGVVVNEVLYDPPGSSDTGLERIELYNNGTQAVNLAGWELYPARTPYFRFGTFTLQPGTWVVIHLRESGTDTPTDLFEGTGATQNMGNTTGSVPLFDSSYHSASTLMDFMEYGAGGQTWESAAVQGFPLDRRGFRPGCPGRLLHRALPERRGQQPLFGLAGVPVPHPREEKPVRTGIN